MQIPDDLQRAIAAEAVKAQRSIHDCAHCAALRSHYANLLMLLPPEPIDAGHGKAYVFSPPPDHWVIVQRQFARLMSMAPRNPGVEVRVDLDGQVSIKLTGLAPSLVDACTQRTFTQFSSSSSGEVCLISPKP